MKQNVTFKLQDSWKFAEEEFLAITAEEWKSRCEHVIKIESDYLANEIKVDVRTEELVIALNADSSDDDLDWSENEDNYSE